MILRNFVYLLKVSTTISRLPQEIAFQQSRKQFQCVLSSITDITVLEKGLIISRNYSNFSRRNYSRYSASTIMSDGGMFCLDDYHIIGFDLDNTLACYNLPEMINLEYEVLAEYLVQNKGYPEGILKPIGVDIEFMQRGLILDAKRGNILKIGCDGTILKASHGTTFMSNEEIKKMYGPDRRWDIASQYVDDPLSAWNGPASEEIRACLDYFDIPASLLLARAVDILDKQNSNKLPESYQIWPDVLDGLVHIYRREAFTQGSSQYFEELKAKPKRYVMKTNSKVIDWLKELKKTKATFLLTGSNIDFSELVATNALGPDWKNLFDVVITYARKPGFFIGNRPFYELSNTMKETSQIDGHNLKMNNVYSQGNWKGLRKFLKQKFGIKNPNCLYIGDNIIQDIYTPSKYVNCDTVSVVNEVEEKYYENTTSHQDRNHNRLPEIISSEKWGSFFEIDNKATFWTDIILNHSKICVSQIEHLTEKPINHYYECFKENCTNLKGFYPSEPLTLHKLKL